MRLIHTLPVVWCCLVFNSSFAAPDRPGNTKYFRSDRGEAYDTQRLPDNFDAPDVLRWKVSMDAGHSTPILTGDRIFLTTWQPASKQLAPVALDDKTGRVLWRNPVVPEQVEQTHEIGSPATATPACDGKRLFVFFGSVGLFCYDLEGNKIWEQRIGPSRDEYGAASSPIVLNGKGILNQAHDIDSFVIAVDAATGKTLWKIPRLDAVRSYSTPVIWEHDGRPEVLVAGALQLTAYDPANGERLWWANGLARIVIPTPVTAGPTIYMASWAPGGDSARRVSFDPC